MSEPKILEVFVIVSTDRQAGDQVRGDFYVTLAEAKTEMERIYQKWAADNPKWIEWASEKSQYAGFQVISLWGQWRSYCIKRIDRADRLADDLRSEKLEGDLAKAGAIG